MALSTYQWQPPDTSWIGQLVMAGARMRQAEEGRQQQAMAKMREDQQRQANLEKSMAFEAENAARLAEQFKVQHAFKQGQATFDNARLTKKDQWEEADRAPFTGGEEIGLPAGDVGAPPAPDSAPMGTADALPPPLPPPGGDMAIPAAPGAEPPPEMIGPPIPAGMDMNAANRIAEKAEMPITGPIIDSLAPPPLQGEGRVSPSQALTGMAKTLKQYRVPTGDARKSIVDAARTMAVQSAKPASASLAGQVRTLPNGDFVIGSSVYRTDPTTGQTVRVGVAPRAGAVLTDEQGNTVVPMANGKFLVNGVVMDNPPSPLNKLPGATEFRRADLADEREDRQRTQGEERIKNASAAQQDRDIARQKDELFKSVEAARREADRAQTDLEQLRKNAVNSPRLAADGKMMMGQRELDQTEFDRLKKKYDDYRTEEETLQNRVNANRVEASSAQKQLDAMQQGRKPNEEATPAVPGDVPAITPASPAAATPAVPVAPVKTVWRKSADGTLWEYDEATKKPTGKSVPGK